ncbi:MAG: carnitine dehydratase [Alphaproteobacteria bacterium]|nr:carnitine dehydratase [Alphaproteobacteria bacterium]
MYQILQGMRVAEIASFIAAPTGALYLRELGADVVRIDPVGGGPDRTRWPLAPSGASLYWEGLNKGKRSVAIDIARPEGRELAAELVARIGLFVTNLPDRGALSHGAIAARRPDLVSVRVSGWADGTQAVDYTVNAATGYPMMTGPADATGPVNHVLPAWDLVAGALAATNLLAAERRRAATGEGAQVVLPLSDVAFSTLARLGQVAEVTLSGADRPRVGNDLFGAFGRDFATADGRRVMLVGLTARQWAAIVAALGAADAIAALQARTGADFALDEGARFVHREAIAAILAPLVARLDLATLGARLDEAGATWSAYRSVAQALAEEPALSTSNPVFEEVAHPSGARHLTPGSAASYGGEARAPVPPAPRLGQHTEEVLAGVLGLASAEIGRLRDAGLVAGS